MTQRMKAAALAYLAQGRSVVPVTPGKKHPPLLRWEEYQHRLPTEAEVTEWWTGTPDANIALITGQVSGISVVDIDGDEGRESFLQNLRGLLPQSLIHHTPRGAHMILKYNPGLKQTAGVLPGIDIRNDGGYIIAPPSIVDGKEYTVFRDRELVALDGVPPGLNGTMPQSPTVVIGDKPTWVATALQGVGEAERNNTAARLIGYFHSKGIPKDIIQSQLTDFARRCTPPMNEYELHRTIDSVTRYRQAAAQEQIMDPPLFSQAGDTYAFSWPTHQVRVQLEDIHYRRDRDLQARLEVTTTRAGVPPRVHGPVTWNLYSTSTRDNLRRYLTKRIDIDWASILEDCVRLTARTFEAGEELVNLPDVVPTAQRYILPPLVRDQEPTIVFGDGGSGKSYLVLAAAMAIQSGEPYIPFPVETRREVLYLDWEADAETHRRRMQRLALGINSIDSLPAIKYRRCSMSLAEHLRQLKEDVAKNSIGLVIVDSAAAAAGGEPESADVAIRFFNALRALKVASLIVAHTTKDQGAKHKPFGSTFWHNESRSTFEVIRQQEEDSEDIEMGLFHRKANDSRLVAPHGLQLRFTTTTAWFESFDLKREASAQMEQHLSHRGRVERYLLDVQRATVQDISESLGLSQAAVQAVLRQGRDTAFLRWADGTNEWANKSRAESF